MRTIEVVYSPLCEATGAMLNQLRQWLREDEVTIQAYPYDSCPQHLKNKLQRSENCFIDVFCSGQRIATVPLRQKQIYDALGIDRPLIPDPSYPAPLSSPITSKQLMEAFDSGELTFHPITEANLSDEMSMCLLNYPFGNPPTKFHQVCLDTKARVFHGVWQLEDIAGVYARYNGAVVGLLEVMPREIIKKYGYMAGSTGNAEEYLSVGCYEVGYGMPRADMLDLLMGQLEPLFPMFRRRKLEGVGICGWEDGFNPYWIYEKHGFLETERLAGNTIVMEKTI